MSRIISLIHAPFEMQIGLEVATASGPDFVLRQTSSSFPFRLAGTNPIAVWIIKHWLRFMVQTGPRA